jgi:hypothetical protein
MRPNPAPIVLQPTLNPVWETGCPDTEFRYGISTANSSERPDLVDPTFNGNSKVGQVYEIKPKATVAQGVTQLITYIGLLNYLDPQHRAWTPGITYEPPQSLTLKDGTTVTVDPPRFGLITYEVDPDSPNGPRGINLFTLSVAFITAALAAGIAAVAAQRGYQ